MNRDRKPRTSPPQDGNDPQVSQAQDIQAEETKSPAEADLQNIQEQLNQAQSQRDEYLAMAQRVQADFDNFRRRNKQVASESFEDGARAFIKTILPVCDNLQRALDAAAEGEKLTTGVVMVQKQLQEIMQKRGVTEISRLGEKFDPQLEDAVTQGNPEDGEPGTVCEVLQKGYRMGDQVIRHAMVKVVPDL